jgi:hypothetical protein
MTRSAARVGRRAQGGAYRNVRRLGSARARFLAIVSLPPPNPASLVRSDRGKVEAVDILPTPEGGGFPPARAGFPASQTGAPLGRVPWRAYPDSTG